MDLFFQQKIQNVWKYASHRWSEIPHAEDM